MMCITPYMHREDTLEFIPDSKFAWNEGPDGRMRPSRDGEKVIDVRRHPARVIAESEWVKAQLESGMNPYRAVDLTEYHGHP